MVPPRSEAQREKERPGYGNAALPDSDRASASEPDAARVPGEGPGKGPTGTRAAERPAPSPLPPERRRVVVQQTIRDGPNSDDPLRSFVSTPDKRTKKWLEPRCSITLTSRSM